MDQPLRFQNPNFPNYVCYLYKSLYGLKQAPREWFHKLTSFLISLSFQGSQIDTSLYFTYVHNILYFMFIYVDDILIISLEFAGISHIISLLQIIFTLRDLENAHFFLGIELIPTSDDFILSQSKYIFTILKRTNMKNCKPTSTLCSCSKLSVTPSDAIDPYLYRSTVGVVQYLTINRPDITFPINQICQTMHMPQAPDWWTWSTHELHEHMQSIQRSWLYEHIMCGGERCVQVCVMCM